MDGNDLASERITGDIFGKPETWENPYPAYSQFRDRSPVVAAWPIVLLDGTQARVHTWLLLKYEQVSAALRDPVTFSSENPAPGLNVLVDRPELWRRLRGDRSLVELAIEETLQYESPVQLLTRFATREVEIGGAKVFQGQAVAVSYGAANRDPAAFSEPDVFRLDRDWSKHLGFGAGIHYCLGAPLARVESQIALNALLDRFSRFSRGDRPAVRQRMTNLLLGFRDLPLEFSA